MKSGAQRNAMPIMPSVCPLDPTPGTDEVLVKGKTRLAAIIEDGWSLEIDLRTGEVLRSMPLPSNDR